MAFSEKRTHSSNLDGSQIPLKQNTESDEDDEGDDARQPPVYQMRPQLSEKFKPLEAKEIIQNVLFDELSQKVYSREESQVWCDEIANKIRAKFRDHCSGRYKFVINVILGEKQGAGVKIGTRCVWDAEADSYAYDSFMNDTIFCTAAVYAVYFY